MFLIVTSANNIPPCWIELRLLVPQEDTFPIDLAGPGFCFDLIWFILILSVLQGISDVHDEAAKEGQTAAPALEDKVSSRNQLLEVLYSKLWDHIDNREKLYIVEVDKDLRFKRYVM